MDHGQPRAPQALENEEELLKVERARMLLYGDIDGGSDPEHDEPAPATAAATTLSKAPVKYQIEARPQTSAVDPAVLRFNPGTVRAAAARRFKRPAPRRASPKSALAAPQKGIVFVKAGECAPAAARTGSLAAGAFSGKRGAPAGTAAAATTTTSATTISASSTARRFQNTNALLAQFLGSCASESTVATTAAAGAGSIPRVTEHESAGYWDETYTPQRPTDYKVYRDSHEWVSEETDWRLYLESLTGVPMASVMPRVPPTTTTLAAVAADSGSVLDGTVGSKEYVHDFAKRILVKYGWKPGQGLGAEDRQGITKALRLAPVKRGVRGRGRIIDKN